MHQYGGCGRVSANKVLVLTLPALRNFEIIARYNGFVVAQTLYFRSKRGWAAQHRR
jgi:hypothetical protein